MTGAKKLASFGAVLAGLLAFATACADGLPQVQDYSSLECEPLVGRQTEIVVFTNTPKAQWCVEVNQTQQIKIVNTGFATTEFEWVDGIAREIEPDSSFVSGVVGDELELGEYRFKSSPYPLPVIRVLEP